MGLKCVTNKIELIILNYVCISPSQKINVTERKYRHHYHSTITYLETILTLMPPSGRRIMSGNILTSCRDFTAV